MDFAWTGEQTALYNQVRKYVSTRINPLVEQRGVDAFFTREEWRECGAGGLLGLSVPKAFGGHELGWVSTARAIEAFGYACEDMGLPFAASAHLFAVAMPIAEFAHEQLSAEILPRMCAGEMIGANAISEAGTGSDVFALQTQVTRDGEYYVLNGTKNFISNGPVADIFVVYGTTNPKHGFLGITAFVVESDTPGVVREQPFYKTGLKSVPASMVHFNDCRIPAAAGLGGRGKEDQFSTARCNGSGPASSRGSWA